jgi:UTP--glucose-1-phosphate uridylyltransferase
MIAILPAAGKGTRMASVTQGLPKELLPLGEKRILQCVLEEALEAGVTDAVVITSPNKPEIAAVLRGVGVLIQEKPTGLGPAIALAPTAPALVLLPDTIFFSSSPAARIVKEVARGCDIVIAVEEVPEDRVSGYGIVEWDLKSGRMLGITEKPAPGETRSRWAVAARYGLSARTMDFLKQVCGGPASAARHRGDGIGEEEIGLTTLLNQAIRAGHSALALPLEANEHRLDCGTPEGYRRAREVFSADL